MKADRARTTVRPKRWRLFPSRLLAAESPKNFLFSKELFVGHCLSVAYVLFQGHSLRTLPAADGVVGCLPSFRADYPGSERFWSVRRCLRTKTRAKPKASTPLTKRFPRMEDPTTKAASMRRVSMRKRPTE